MNDACAICGGACCESMFIEWKNVHGNDRNWLAFHGMEWEDGVELPCRCHKLGPLGECRIYNDRPHTCRVYQVGGAACLRAIKRRRSAMVELAVVRSILHDEIAKEQPRS